MLDGRGSGLPGIETDEVRRSGSDGNQASDERRVRPRRWRRTYLLGVIAGDALGVMAAGVAAQVIRFGASHPTPLSATVHVPYPLLSACLAPLWLLTLALSGVFDQRRLGVGAEEYRAIAEASVRFLAVVAAGGFLLQLNLFSRGYVLLLLPLTPGLTMLVHYLARRWLHRRRAMGLYQRRTVVVGSPAHVAEVVDHLRSAPYAGLDVVGACVPDGAVEPPVQGHPVELVASPEALLDWIRSGGAEQVVVADASVFGSVALRRFAWDLEVAGVDLIVAPTVTQFAGPRIAVRQAGGLPLLHVEAPRLDGFRRLVKGSLERIFAVTMLCLLLPVFLIVALLVKGSSRGPVLFRQARIGKDGDLFTMLKFRTMVDGAEAQLAKLVEDNEADGCLFKIKEDPRITAVGRVLRRFSIDELPQLAHVLTGKMSLVGPRPLPAREKDRHDEEALRRLLVRPGLTGLWQISGRWELSWMESVRLDLYYVENWSLALDVIIVAKTLGAVLRDRGSS